MVSPRTVAVGLLVGVLITVLSAISPARRAARIPPVAALQDVAAEPRLPLVRRTAVGVVFTSVGLVVLGCRPVQPPERTGCRWSAPERRRCSSASPRSARSSPARSAACSARRWHGPARVGKLGQQNAMRNPSRAAATAAALMVGVSLVSMTTVMASSVKASSQLGHRLGAAGGLRRQQRRGVAGGAQRVQPSVERSLAALPQVATWRESAPGS